MAKPSAQVLRHLTAEFRRLGLEDRLGSALFLPTNWHQSLSDRFEDEPTLVDKLLRSGAKITARAVSYNIDRVESQQAPDSTYWWAFKPDHTPDDFNPLLDGIQTAISAETGCRQGRHTPHLSVSYWAPEHLPRMVQIEPIEWILDEVLLVRGGGSPYSYEVLGSWRLLPARATVVCEQAQLF